MAQEVVRPFNSIPEMVERSKKVSTVFNRLVLTITAKYPSSPGMSKCPIILKPSEKMAIQYLRRNTTGEELTSIIFDNPPMVIAKVGDDFENEVSIRPTQFLTTYPTVDDIMAANKSFKLPEGIDPDFSARIEDAVRFFKSYMATPKTNDGLTDHNLQRAPWRAGVDRVLAQVYKVNPNRTDEDRDWNWIFNKRWINNRHAGNKRTNLIVAVELLLMEELPVNLKKHLEATLGRLTHAQWVFNNVNIDSGVDLLVKECVDVINVFSD
jgi:hypothetical protein